MNAPRERTSGRAGGTPEKPSVTRTARRPPARRRRRPARQSSPQLRRVAAVALVVGGAFVLLAAARTAEAAREGLRARRALGAVERDLTDRRLDAARSHLDEAERSFRNMKDALDRGGPAMAVARVVPLARVQVRGIEAFGDAGILVTGAGLQIVEAFSDLTDPGDRRMPASAALEQLRAAAPVLADGVSALDAAIETVRRLDRYRLLPPLSGARQELVTRLERARVRTAGASESVDALIAFAGGSGPRRYLLFSQNPDEVRPTGGFMGTYGVLATGDGGLHLERYESTGAWDSAHPEASIPLDRAGSPFRFYDSNIAPQGQTLANANNLPDWPRTARLAMEMWERGGERPVDGVLSVTPGFLAGALGVLGPVEVRDFRERITASNLRERFDFYTREDEERTPTGNVKKEFIAHLAKAVIDKVLEAPPSQWVDLAATVGTSFESRDLMAWSRDEAVATALSRRGWDGTLPEIEGDFLFDAEFEHQAKNGRSLRRTFDHTVVIREDGSGLVTTVITITNPGAARRFNPSSLAYHTIYGPAGATLDPSSDPPAAIEPSLRGHPAAGWFKAAQPQGEARWKVVWQVPVLARRLPDGSWAYGLWVMKLPDHDGDVVNLKVELPAGWRWKGPEPPTRTELNDDFVGLWRYSR